MAAETAQTLTRRRRLVLLLWRRRRWVCAIHRRCARARTAFRPSHVPRHAGGRPAAPETSRQLRRVRCAAPPCSWERVPAPAARHPSSTTAVTTSDRRTADTESTPPGLRLRAHGTAPKQLARRHDTRRRCPGLRIRPVPPAAPLKWSRQLDGSWTADKGRFRAAPLSAGRWSLEDATRGSGSVLERTEGVYPTLRDARAAQRISETGPANGRAGARDGESFVSVPLLRRPSPEPFCASWPDG